MKEIADILSFFKNSETVWVSENFKNLILEKYVETETRNYALGFANLQNIQTNTEKLVFENSDHLLEQLALLIQNQPNGEEGKLLNDSSANYFFVKGKDNNLYSVLVRWESAQRLWRCGAYLQEELKLPGIRVFYPE